MQIRINQTRIRSCDLWWSKACPINLFDLRLNLCHLLCHLNELILVLFSQLGELVNILRGPNLQRNVDSQGVLITQL